ncbi:MAG: hypothetical protein K2X77_31180 [Candidatus Obscuribacterales bacterium]|jgi:hypothetical protein|nr:hypothetical protein [Candidatus Obscuribacterales bacterium]
MLDTQERQQPSPEESSAVDNAEGLEEGSMAEPEKERKLPLWAILLAVGAFLLFNAFFLSFALSVQSGAPQ